MTELGSNEGQSRAVKRLSRRSLLKGTAAIGLATVGAQLGAGSVSAETTPTRTATPTATSTPTGTPAPDANATKRATLQTAIAKQIETNEIADLEKTATAIVRPPAGTPIPTEAPKPTQPISPTAAPTVDVSATAAARATIADASARYRAGLQATATEQAKPTRSDAQATIEAASTRIASVREEEQAKASARAADEEAGKAAWTPTPTSKPVVEVGIHPSEVKIPTEAIVGVSAIALAAAVAVAKGVPGRIWTKLHGGGTAPTPATPAPGGTSPVEMVKRWIETKLRRRTPATPTTPTPPTTPPLPPPPPPLPP